MTPNVKPPTPFYRCRRFWLIVVAPAVLLAFAFLMLPIYVHSKICRRLDHRITLNHKRASVQLLVDAIDRQTPLCISVTASGYCTDAFSYSCRSRSLLDLTNDLHESVGLEFYICDDTLWIHDEEIEGVLMHYERTDRFVSMGFFEKVKWFWFTERDYYSLRWP